MDLYLIFKLISLLLGNMGICENSVFLNWAHTPIDGF